MTADLQGPSSELDALAKRVPVLMYHRVDARIAREERRYCVTARQFAQHLDWLSENGYRPCTVRAFDDWFCGRATLPSGTVLITFDDGFAGLHEHVFPLLRARGWPATVFLVSAAVGQRDHWGSSEFGAAGSQALLGRAQIAEMASHGFEFHSHTRAHPDLTALNQCDLVDQVRGSRAELQDMLGLAVDYFAYPFGRFDQRVRAAVQEAGYRLAFSVSPGFNRPGGDPLAVRRLDITGHDSKLGFGRMVTMGTNDGSPLNHFRYLGRQLLARFQPNR